jgi:phage tail-like protein
MTASKYCDPYHALRFRIEIDGLQRGGFREASGLDATNEVVQYREGNEADLTVHKLPGLTTYSNIVLKGGLTDDHTFYDWKQTTVKGKTERKNGSIILLDDAGDEKIRWNFHRGWITKWSGPAFNATSNDVAIESIEIAHEGVVLA